MSFRIYGKKLEELSADEIAFFLQQIEDELKRRRREKPETTLSHFFWYRLVPLIGCFIMGILIGALIEKVWGRIF